MSLTDQTIGFFLSLDVGTWDKSVVKVEAGYKKFVGRMDKLSEQVGKTAARGVVTAAQASVKQLEKLTAQATTAVKSFEKRLASKPLRVPIELVMAGSKRGSGMDAALSQAVTAALMRTRVWMRPMTSRDLGQQSALGQPRDASGQFLPKGAAPGYIGTFMAGRAGRKFQTGSRGGRARAPRADVTPSWIRPSETIMPDWFMDAFEDFTRRAARGGMMSQHTASAATGMRADAQFGVHLRELDRQQARLLDLIERQQTGEVVSPKRAKTVSRLADRSIARTADYLGTLTDPRAQRAGRAFLQDLAEETAQLQERAQGISTRGLFSPAYWRALGQQSAGVMRMLAHFLGTSRTGRGMLGAGMMVSGAAAIANATGITQAGEYLNSMTGDIVRATGAGRGTALGGAAGVLGMTSGALTRDEILPAFQAALSSGIRGPGLGFAAEQIGLMRKGFGASEGMTAGIWQTGAGRFDMAVGALTDAFGRVAGAATQAGLSFDELAAIQEDFLSATGTQRGMMGGAQAAATLARTFGGGRQGLAAARSILAPLAGAARGDIGGIQSLAMLGADPRLLFASEMDPNAVIKSIDFNRFKGMNRFERFAFSQRAGVDVDAVLALQRKGKITEADLRTALDPNAQARATQTKAQEAMNTAAAAMDNVASALPSLTTELNSLTGALYKLVYTVGATSVFSGGFNMFRSVFKGGVGGGARAAVAGTAAAGAGGALGSAARWLTRSRGIPAVGGLARGAGILGGAARIGGLPGVGALISGALDPSWSNLGITTGTTALTTAGIAALGKAGLAGSLAAGGWSIPIAGAAFAAGGGMREAYNLSSTQQELRGIGSGAAGADARKRFMAKVLAGDADPGSFSGVTKFFSGIGDWAKLDAWGSRYTANTEAVQRGTREELQNTLFDVLRPKYAQYGNDPHAARALNDEVSKAMEAYRSTLSGGGTMAEAATAAFNVAMGEDARPAKEGDTKTHELIEKLIRVVERRPNLFSEA